MSPLYMPRNYAYVGASHRAHVGGIPLVGYRREFGMSVGGIFDDIGDFISDCCKACGRLIESGIEIISKIPIIGAAFSAAFHLVVAPLNFAMAVASGTRIDQAFMAEAKNVIAATRELAPYIQSVLSVVPGIGTVAGAAIAGGLALASGLPIDQVLLSAVAGAVPGGMLGKALFKVTVAAARGENVQNALISAATAAVGVIPGGTIAGALRAIAIPEGAYSTLATIAGTVAAGKDAAVSTYEKFSAYIPSDVKTAANLAISYGQGSQIQKATVAQVQQFGPAELGSLSALGTQYMTSHGILQTQANVALAAAQKKSAKSAEDVLRGITVGYGLICTSEVNESEVMAVRSKLINDDLRIGFDGACACHIGAVVAPKPPAAVAASSAAKVGFYTTAGIANAATYQKQAALSTVAVDPVAKAGASVALQLINAQLAGTPDEILSHVRAVVGRLDQHDAATLAAVQNVQVLAGQGNDRAKKLLLMIDTVRQMQKAEAGKPWFEVLWERMLTIPQSFFQPQSKQIVLAK